MTPIRCCCYMASRRGRFCGRAGEVSAANRAAWNTLCDSTTPMLVAFSDSDPITGPMAEIFASQMRGAQGVDHPVIRDAGHFLQEDAGPELAEAIARFMRHTR